MFLTPVAVISEGGGYEKDNKTEDHSVKDLKEEENEVSSGNLEDKSPKR